MLVATRRVGEQIIIRPPGLPPIVVDVLEKSGRAVKIGVTADRKIEVNRAEVDRTKHPGDYQK